MVFIKVLFQVIITDLGEIGENAIIVFEENVGVGAEETVANQEYVSFSNDDDVIQVCRIIGRIPTYKFASDIQ